MTSKIGSTTHLQANATAKHAPAVVEVAHSLAGRPRVIWEMAHGASAASDPAIAPKNPQDADGVDLSGPPFGAALLLPVVTFGDGYTGDAVAPQTRWRAVDDTGVERPFSFWNRPHATRADGLAPLQRFMFAWYCRASGAGSTVWRFDFQSPVGTATITRTIASSAEAVYEETVMVPVAPGRNAMRIRMRRTSGSTTMHVYSWSLLVAAKRRHGLSFPG